MKSSMFVILAAVLTMGCDARRPVQRAARDKFAKLAEATQHARDAINKAAQDPEVTPRELAVITVLEEARQSLIATEITLSDDVSGAPHPLGGALQSELWGMLIEALEETLAENEAHHEVCVKTARECEDEFPQHAESLRDVAAKLATANRITDLRLHRLRKAK